MPRPGRSRGRGSRRARGTTRPATPSSLGASVSRARKGFLSVADFIRSISPFQRVLESTCGLYSRINLRLKRRFRPARARTRRPRARRRRSRWPTRRARVVTCDPTRSFQKSESRTFGEFQRLGKGPWLSSALVIRPCPTPSQPLSNFPTGSEFSIDTCELRRWS